LSASEEISSATHATTYDSGGKHVSLDLVALETTRIRDLTLANIGNVPQDLRKFDRWVLYKIEARGGKTGAAKLTKPPVDPITGRKASASAPSSHLTFNQAYEALWTNRLGNLAGVGLSLDSSMGLVGVDLDDALGDDGLLLPWAQPIVEQVDSFTEISPSGRGLHILGRGDIPANGGKHGGCEAYKHDRYLTITGKIFENRGWVKDFAPAGVTWYWSTFIKPSEKAKAAAPDGTPVTPPPPLSDQEILALIDNASNREKIHGLLNCDKNSDSTASLIGCLGFYTTDPYQIERLVRTGKPRDKWDQMRGDDNFLVYDIKRLLASREGDHYRAPPPLDFSSLVDKGTRPANGKPKFNMNPISAADLQNKEFAAMKWAVPGLLPEGMTVLAGRPKKGKSWMALGLGIAIASGGVAFGKEKVEKGKVLYLALEDSERRMQTRISALIPPGGTFPPWLHIVTADPKNPFPAIDAGGMDAITDWLDSNPDTRLLIVDTLAKIKPGQKSGGDAYQQDYSFSAQLQGLAISRGIALLAITHTKKAVTEDVFDRITGTTGNTAAADAMWVLESSPQDRHKSALHITGRDVDPTSLAMVYDKGAWTCEGEADEFFLSPERQAIVNILGEKGPMTAGKISEALGMPKDNTYKMLFDMKRVKQVFQDGSRGKYFVMSELPSLPTPQ
jgi:hypothetical protein